MDPTGAAGVHNVESPVVTDLAALTLMHGDRTYREFLRVPALSLGVFAPPAGHDDTQQPHQQDEVYVVLAGRAVLEIDGVGSPVAPGAVVYVPARVPHRFVDITEDLRIIVLFAPPEVPEP
jgi:mannose-6-phosphate isomerase-like protein (cupin superfamily)